MLWGVLDTLKQSRLAELLEFQGVCAHIWSKQEGGTRNQSSTHPGFVALSGSAKPKASVGYNSHHNKVIDFLLQAQNGHFAGHMIFLLYKMMAIALVRLKSTGKHLSKVYHSVMENKMFFLILLILITMCF